MIRSLLLCALLAGIGLPAPAQTGETVSYLHYDSLDNPTDSVGADYYLKTITTYSATGFVERHEMYYTSSGRKRMVARYVANGSYRTFFHPGGEAMAQGAFQGDRMMGTFKLFYKSGKPQADILFPEDSDEGVLSFRIVNFWDESGNQLVQDGNGSGEMNFVAFKGRLTPGKGSVLNGLKQGEWSGAMPGGIYIEKYDNGRFVGGEAQIGGKTVSYKKITENSSMAPLYKHVGNKLVYPKSLRSQGIDGRVLVEFVLLENGTVSRPRIAKNLHPDIDAEVLRVVASAPKLEPTRKRGVPVRTTLLVPISIHLQ